MRCRDRALAWVSAVALSAVMGCDQALEAVESEPRPLTQIAPPGAPLTTKPRDHLCLRGSTGERDFRSKILKLNDAPYPLVRLEDCYLKRLDLAGVAAEKVELELHNVRIEELDLEGAQFRAVSILGADIDRLTARYARVGDTFEVRHPNRHTDQHGAYAHDWEHKTCRMPDARWRTGGTVVRTFDGSNLRAHLLDLSGLIVDEKLTLRDVHVDDDLALAAAQLREADLQGAHANDLAADGLVVTGGLRLFAIDIARHVDLACADLGGEVNATSLHAGGILQLSFARFGGAGHAGDAGADAEFSVMEVDDVQASGIEVAGALRFDAATARAINLRFARIGKGLGLGHVRAERIDLTGLKVGPSGGRGLVADDPRCGRGGVRLCVTGTSAIIEDARGLDAALAVLAIAPLDLSTYAAMEQRLRDGGQHAAANRVFLAGRYQEATHSRGWWATIVNYTLWWVGYGRRPTSTYGLFFIAAWLVGAGALELSYRHRKRRGRNPPVKPPGFLLALDILLPTFIDLHCRSKYIDDLYRRGVTRFGWGAYHLVGWALASLVLVSVTRYFA